LTLLLGTIDISLAINYGLGRHVTALPLDKLDRLTLCGHISLVLDGTAQMWSKTSFAITILRLVEGKWRALVWFMIITINLLGGVGCLLFWINCTPLPHVWTPSIPGTCWDTNITIDIGMVSSGKSEANMYEASVRSLTLVTIAYSGACDLALVLVSWRLILPLRMRTTEKVGVAIAMSFGIL
jgi:hypothetical protein